MARGDKLMTTSCCPAYLRAVKIHVPELIPCVSDTQTPMHYTAEIAKKDDSECITVFIGPCLAKRWEGMNDALVDYVLSIEELEALFKAKDIDPNTIEVRHCERPAASLSGRNFAKSGGVSEAIRVRLKDSSAMRPEVINGLSRTGMAELARFGKIQAGKIPQAPDTPNLVEVMACEGGCIAGPQVICNLRAATAQLSKYAEDL
jgi:iron only hydrogenase large subunit-like protein